MAYTWPLPLNAVISQRFGTNPYSPVQPSGHTGMDFAVPEGTSVRALGDGVVLWADWATKMSPSNPWYIAPGYAGIVVLIDHGNLISVSAHLSTTSLNAGNRVKQGQEIGLSGNTGLSSGPHLHLEVIPLPLRVTNALYGRADPLKYMSAVIPTASAPLAPNQRRVGSGNVNHRSEPKTDSKVVRLINANTIETFSGWVEGESVTIPGIETVRHDFTSNIWYKDAQGYAWAGGFTEQKTAGLPNLTPPPPIAPNERVVISSGAIQRAAPDRTGRIIRDIKGGTKEVFTGFVRGEPVNGSDIWFRDTIGYVWSGGFTNTSTQGLPDQTPEAGTRTSGAAAIAYRKAPRLNGEIAWYLDPNTSFVFDAFTHGDTYEGSDIWFRGKINKHWAHSSLFTSQYTGGMTEVKYEPEPVAPPKPPTPTPTPTPATKDREVGPAGVRVRNAPTTAGEVLEVVEGGKKVTVTAYVEAPTEVSGSRIWFERDKGGYVHASGLNDASIVGLEKRTVSIPVTPEEETYSFTPDFDFVEYQPANYWNMGNGNFPTSPQKIVLHQFDAKEKKPSIEGVITHFQLPRKDKPSSAHFGVSKGRIIQFVSLQDRAFHAGPIGNDYIGIEVDPQEDAETIASVKKLIKALNKKYGKVFTYSDHRTIPQNNTLCGADIHLEKYDVTEVPPTAPEDLDRPTWEDLESAEKVIKWAKKQYQNSVE